MFKYEETKWIIMSKDRNLIATGNPRSRELISVSGLKKQRILSYESKGKAEGAFKNYGFYGQEYDKDRRGYLEAVPVKFAVEEITKS